MIQENGLYGGEFELDQDFPPIDCTMIDPGHMPHNKTFVDGVWKTPEEIQKIQKEIEDKLHPINEWWATKLAFRNRFTMTEKATIEYAAAQNTMQGAMMRAQLADQRDAKYIDLKRQDTRDGVHALEAGGILTAGRADIILDTPLTDEERFTG